jgi:hypothetical protein
MKTFKESILESDQSNYSGAIERDENFKVIKVGAFEVGKSASYITPVEKKINVIIRFDLPWAVFSSGRVDVTKLIGWEVNPAYEQWHNKQISEYNAANNL